MRVLVLGARGMAGHVIKDYLLESEGAEVWWTIRGLPTTANELTLHAEDSEQLRRVVEKVRPDVVVNAVGVLNEAADQNPITAIQINSILPHQLKQLGTTYAFRVIHISTDCVFSGQAGGYTEMSPTDGMSMYARTKSLGELHDAPHLTIRTSIVGPELKPSGIGLFHWFMHQSDLVRGYQNVYWNGVTTLELAKFIRSCLSGAPTGLIHLCHPQPVSKLELLRQFQETFDKQDVTIVPALEPVSDRTLTCTRSDVHWAVPPYAVMIREMREWMESHSKEMYSYAF